MKYYIFLFSALLVSLFLKADDSKLIYQFEIKDQIAPPMVRMTSKAIDEATALEAELIILHMNTYGGMLDAADSIRTKIMKSDIPIIVFIDNNAASAGALISIACDSIFMHPGANIGAATVVNQNAEAMPDKYQSYMRSMMRSTAEYSGRDPKIAEAMVDEQIYIKEVSDSGKVLTFTTTEAIEHNYCEGKAETIEDVLRIMGIEDYSIVKQEVRSTDKIINLLVSPAVSGILIMIIIGGIYFELQSPGIGFPIFASIAAATLYFAPHYLEGLADNWEILIFVLGILLVAVEMFAIPGFGIAGISGIILIIGGLTLSMVNNIGFNFSIVAPNEIANSLAIVVLGTFVSLGGSLFLTQKMLSQTTGPLSNFALNKSQNNEDGYTVAQTEYTELIGQLGITVSILRPAGKIEINNRIYDATAETGYIDPDSKIRVIGYENSQLIVEKDA